MMRSSAGRRPRRRVGIVALLVLPLVVVFSLRLVGSPAPSAVRSMPLPPGPNDVAQATEVPPIATCDPALMTPPPPGLHPYVLVEDAGIYQARRPDGCPLNELRLSIRLFNAGQAPSQGFAMRMQGCGFGRMEVTVEGLDEGERRNIEFVGPGLPQWPCEILLEPSCKSNYFEHYWTGPIAYPELLPTCTPGPSPTATGGLVTETPTSSLATATATAEQEGGRAYLPLLP